MLVDHDLSLLKIGRRFVVIVGIGDSSRGQAGGQKGAKDDQGQGMASKATTDDADVTIPKEEQTIIAAGVLLSMSSHSFVFP